MTRPNNRGRLRNPATRYVLYEYLALRDGRRCLKCGVPDSERELVIDHKDGNTMNWALINLRLLCRRCNLPNKGDKSPMGTPYVCESVIVRTERGLMLREASPEIRLNRESEPQFRRWLMGRLISEGRVFLADVINGGAEACGISPMTARRYLAKMVSSTGPLCILEGTWVYVKPEHWAKLGVTDPKD